MLQRLIDKSREEVALVWGAVLVVVTGLQTQAVELPRAVHIAVFLVTALLTFLGIRTASTPNVKA